MSEEQPCILKPFQQRWRGCFWRSADKLIGADTRRVCRKDLTQAVASAAYQLINDPQGAMHAQVESKVCGDQGQVQGKQQTSCRGIRRVNVQVRKQPPKHPYWLTWC